jgi:2-dehydro-3-deoxy-D-arabinonate dehydratase
MKLYRTRTGAVVEHENETWEIPAADWNTLLNRPNPIAALLEEKALFEPLHRRGPVKELSELDLLPPVHRQEVWAAGVTYFRSRVARMEESKEAGGGSFYDRVYDADRPELFLKATPFRVIPHGGEIRIRKDSKWNVPEPELALVINARGDIVGYTVGNDVSSRDIEGENPLYLPQAKYYDGSCALGPGILLTDGPLPPETAIRLEILRAGEAVFQGETSLAQIKRSFDDLVRYLYLETTFPDGAVLLTGTGIIPEDSFTLQSGDEVRITIPPIGTLVNRVA